MMKSGQNTNPQASLNMSIYTKCGINENSELKLRKKIQDSGYFKIKESRGCLSNTQPKTESFPKKQAPST